MTLLGKILAIANVVVALVFAFLVILNAQKRHEAALAVYLHDRSIKGLPVEDKQADPGLPRDRYLEKQPPDEKSESLKQDLGGTGQPVNVQVKEVARLKNDFF